MAFASLPRDRARDEGACCIHPLRHGYEPVKHLPLDGRPKRNICDVGSSAMAPFFFAFMHRSYCLVFQSIARVREDICLGSFLSATRQTFLTRICFKQFFFSCQEQEYITCFMHVTHLILVSNMSSKNRKKEFFRGHVLCKDSVRNMHKTCVLRLFHTLENHV